MARIAVVPIVRALGCASHTARLLKGDERIWYEGSGDVYLATCGRRIFSPEHVGELGVPTCKDCLRMEPKS